MKFRKNRKPPPFVWNGNTAVKCEDDVNDPERNPNAIFKKSTILPPNMGTRPPFHFWMHEHCYPTWTPSPSNRHLCGPHTLRWHLV